MFGSYSHLSKEIAESHIQPLYIDDFLNSVFRWQDSIDQILLTVIFFETNQNWLTFHISDENEQYNGLWMSELKIIAHDV